MKNLNFLSLLMILGLLFAVQPASAVVSVQNDEATTTTISKKELKKQQRMEKMTAKIEKKIAKWEKKMEKKGVDFSDPVNKWLWYAIFAWVAAVVLYILAALTLGALWYVAHLVSLAGTIFFIVWLLKILELM